MIESTIRKRQVTVIGDAEADHDRYEMAYEVGKIVAESGSVLITGGRTGVMEAASKGAYENKGMVVGILPGNNFSEANPFCHLVLPTGVGHARNSQTILAADVVIAIGGKAGTLSEISFAWIYQKPIILIDFAGGLSNRLAELAKKEPLPANTLIIDSLTGLKMNLNQLLQKPSKGAINLD